MLDLKYLREHPEDAERRLKIRNPQIDLRAILKADEERRQLQKRCEDLRALKNEASKKIAAAKPEERAKIIEETRTFDSQSDNLNSKFEKASEHLETLLRQLPNLQLDDVPVGPDESANQVLRQVGQPPNFDFAPKDHVALGKNLGLIDSEQAVEVSGARFSYLLGDLVLLQNALYQLALSILLNVEILENIRANAGAKVKIKPFIPVVPPLLVKTETLEKMGRLEPKEERYAIPTDDLYLVGSAEHSLGPILMGKTVQEADLPLRYFALTPAFRREAGSYGKDTRGILRLHQFDKLEMETFSLPEEARAEQDFIVAIQEYFVRALEIPYQVIAVCTGDMGSPDARQIDLECWMPGQGKYRETHTSDFMTDFQARRLGAKVKRANNGASEFLQMNDATLVAMGRMLIAIIENYQQEDGRIAVPKVLQKWLGKKIIG